MIYADIDLHNNIIVEQMEYNKKRELEEYREYLEELAESKSTDMFSNGGKEHASILMSVLLQNTNKVALMYCEGFKPDLIATQPYWDALNEFLKNPEHELHVLVQSERCQDQKPLLMLHEMINQGSTNILVKKISKTGKAIIEERYGEDPCNFAVFDDEKFRFEYNPTEYKAFGSFNKPDECRDLKDVFVRAFNASTPLWQN